MPNLQIGVLTCGKPTLGMVLAGLILQELNNIQIHIVDTAERPVINRDDVRFAMRLGFDRKIHCGYEHVRDAQRPFSEGRLRLLKALDAPLVCFMDDDVVMNSTTLPRLLQQAKSAGRFGYVAPTCHNSPLPSEIWPDRAIFVPGTIFHQDRVVRRLLLRHYAHAVDVLDRAGGAAPIWEIACLTELFHTLGRPCLKHPQAVVYHLDQAGQPRLDLAKRELLTASIARARLLARQLQSA